MGKASWLCPRCKCGYGPEAHKAGKAEGRRLERRAIERIINDESMPPAGRLYAIKVRWHINKARSKHGKGKDDKKNSA